MLQSLLVCGALTALAGGPPNAESLGTLAGTWVTVARFDQDGKAERLGEADPQRFQLTFRDDRVTMTSKRASFEAAVRVDNTANPKRLTLTRKRRNGRVDAFDGIYELTGDKLRLCLAGPGDPLPEDFRSGPGIEIAAELSRDR